MARAFVFDMDGCLLDSIKIWHESEQRILDEAGVELTKEQRDRLNALTLEEAGQFFHDLFGIGQDGQAVSAAIIDHMLAFYRTEVEASPGAYEFVKNLYDAGERLCVLSSSPQSFLQAGLEHAGMKRFFEDDLIISAEDQGWAKRDPMTFVRVCERLGAEPRDTWLFDDSWYALQTASGVGLHTVGVFSCDGCGTHEELGLHSERVIDSFEEITISDIM